VRDERSLPKGCQWRSKIPAASLIREPGFRVNIIQIFGQCRLCFFGASSVAGIDRGNKLASPLFNFTAERIATAAPLCGNGLRSRSFIACTCHEWRITGIQPLTRKNPSVWKRREATICERVFVGSLPATSPTCPGWRGALMVAEWWRNRVAVEDGCMGYPR